MKSIKTLFVLLIALTVATTASAYNFTKDLELGARGSDVTKLQEMLSGAGYLESDSVTGYFGSATELAVVKWQVANGIKPISGIFGAISRAIAASVPVANLSSATYADEDPAPLTYMQARNAVDILLRSRLITKRNYERALGALFSEPSIVMTDSKGNQGITVKVGETFTISGIPKNLQGLSYYFGSGFPQGNYYNRAYFFDPIFNDVCSNNEASTTGPWTMTCTPKTTGTGKIHVEIYKDGKIFTSNIVEVTVVPNTSENLSLALVPNPNRSMPEGFKSYTLKSPNDSGKVVVWKIAVDCSSEVLFYSNGVNKCGQEFIFKTDGRPLNEEINFKNTSQTREKSATVRVWTYSKFEATTPDTGSQYQLQSGEVSIWLAPDSDATPPAIKILADYSRFNNTYTLKLAGGTNEDPVEKWDMSFSCSSNVSGSIINGPGNICSGIGYVMGSSLNGGDISVPIVVRSADGSTGKITVNIGALGKDVVMGKKTYTIQIDPEPVTSTPVVTPVKLTSAQICAVVQKPTTSTCVRSYPIFKGTEKMAGYMYNGFKYDISYNKYANSAGAVCRDTCTAKVY